MDMEVFDTNVFVLLICCFTSIDLYVLQEFVDDESFALYNVL